jgi:protein-tyrosine-phosphatase
VRSDSLTLLIICKANECRSVYAADRLREASAFSMFEIFSAGVGALPGSPQCLDSVTESSIVHQSRQVERADIEKADIVLTMERGQKSRIAEILPTARSKTFTLTEAAHLSECLLPLNSATNSEFDLQFLPNWEKSPINDRFVWFVTQLNEVRSFVEPEKREVVDAHGADATTHSETFSVIEEQVARINKVLMSSDLRLEIGSV